VSLEIGSLVRQYIKGQHRQGVIYKKTKQKTQAIIPWTYFEVLWATGERSIERTDHIQAAPDLVYQFNDLIVLKDLQDSIKAGASYD